MPQDYVGQSDVSNLNVTGPAFDVKPQYDVRALEVNTDPYKLMPEIAYRAWHQQRFAPQTMPTPKKKESLFGKGAPPSAVQQAQQLGTWGSTKVADPFEGMEPTFVKMAGIGPNQIMGYMPSSGDMPGAVQSGWKRSGTGYRPPQNVTFGGMLPESPAGLSPNLPPTMSQLPGNPYATWPGSLSGNPWGTGPGRLSGGRILPEPEKIKG